MTTNIFTVCFSTNRAISFVNSATARAFADVQEADTQVYASATGLREDTKNATLLSLAALHHQLTKRSEGPLPKFVERDAAVDLVWSELVAHRDGGLIEVRPATVELTSEAPAKGAKPDDGEAPTLAAKARKSPAEGKPKTERPPRPPGSSVPRSAISGKLIVLSAASAKENPRKVGTAGNVAMEIVRKHVGPITVDEYLKAGGERKHLQWDIDHGFVTLVDPK